MSDTSFGSGLNFDANAGATSADVPLATPVNAPPAPVVTAPPDPGTKPASGGGIFGSGIGVGFFPNYRAPDPEATALDQTADTLTQRIKRANEISTNPLAQVFAPEDVEKARAFIPAATEQLQKIRTQKADMAAGRTQAEVLGLSPGEAPDEATQADRIQVAQAKALKGDLRTFKGLQAVDPKAAEAIADQVYEVTATHLTKAQLAFDSLSGMRNQGQYSAKLNQLRQEGTLSSLEALGLKVPPSFDAFSAARPREAQALREAQIGLNNVRQRLEDRNTYQPMEEKEAKTYNGRLTTAFGDQVTNGTWSRNGAAGTRGLIVNGAADPRDLGTKFTLASPEQRKAIKEELDGAVPKADMDKYREFNRTYKLATEDAKGNAMADGKINTNPNVQQGIAEGLASMLRGGSGGANVGLLKIELAKRGWAQGAIDGFVSNYAGAINTMFKDADKPYLSQQTQKQIRDVMDVLKTYNDTSIADRAGSIAQRAGALGLDSAALGLGKKEAGALDAALEEGRRAQIARMMPNHQAIGGGDGVLQLGAQRPGVGAVQPPQGAGPAATQLPGAQPLQTPVQQATQPQPGSPSPGGGPSAGTSTTPGPAPAPAGGSPSPTAPQPVAVAGQQVAWPAVPGTSPAYVSKLQAVETPNQKNPWTATTGRGPDGKMLSSAGGAFQFIDSTWNANKPPGAPDKAKDATPEQQATALANLTAKNAATLTQLKLPVNDTTLYMAHNVGAGGAASLLSADPGADARTVVGEAAARNNPTFFRGRPTVATVLQRYTEKMGDGAGMQGDISNTGGPAPAGEKPGLMTRISRVLSQGIPGGDAAKDAAVKKVGDAAVDHAPAIGSTLGSAVGTLGGPLGTIAGGAVGGGAGQSLKDYVQGRSQNPTEIAKQAALGGVLGVASEARPVLAAATRVGGSAAVEAGADAAEKGASPDTVDAGLKGAAEAVGGEMFGRALGMVAHKTFGLFTKDAQKTVQTAAKDLHEANEVLKKEAPTLPAAEGKTVPNPAYEAAQASKEKAEATIKEMLPSAKPDEVAYAHAVTKDRVPKQEAEVSRPGAVERARVGEGYQQLESEVGAAGKGAVKASPKLPDGPVAAVENKKVSAKHAELADHVEMAITAPAKNWQEKWTQLKDARSQLLEAERDALSSLTPGRSKEAADMRVLADSVRAQQEKVAKYVFGEKDGPAFMERLKVLDTRYRRLMDATNGGDIMKAAGMKGEAGRDAEKKFVAFAHDDPQAVAAYRALRGLKGDVSEATVPWTVAAEGIPGVGKVVKAAKLVTLMKEWVRERAAGSPVKFSDLVKANTAPEELGRGLRNAAGTVAQRATVQGDMLSGANQ